MGAPVGLSDAAVTWLSNDLTDGRYTVLEFPRGPRLGTVRCAGTRQWIARCERCDWLSQDRRTRPLAAAVLGHHYRRMHLR